MDFLHDDKANPIVAWPMRLYDCSPVSDGAAVVLLVSDDLAHKFTDHPVYVAGMGQASDGALHDRPVLHSIPSARIAGEQAYKMAGITPAEIDFAEVHDCFTVAEVIASEDLGFFERGKGWIAAEEGVTARDGSKPINLSGGLKSKVTRRCRRGWTGGGGFKQLRGQAGARQMQGQPKYGLTHNVGGTGQTCVVNIFERRE